MSNPDFFELYYSGLGGIGWWLLLFVIATAVYVYMWYDSERRNLSAREWKLAALLLPTLLLPTLFFRFSGPETQTSLQAAKMPFLYLGLLGGIIPVIVAVGYYMTFQGMQHCARGHLYDHAQSGSCPDCAVLDAPRPPAPPRPAPPRVRTPCPKTHTGWLLESASGRRHDLCVGITLIGRDALLCDVALPDPAVSKAGHVQIRQLGSNYVLEPLPGRSQPMLNGTPASRSVTLQNGDTFTVGDTELKVVIL